MTQKVQATPLYPVVVHRVGDETKKAVGPPKMDLQSAMDAAEAAVREVGAETFLLLVMTGPGDLQGITATEIAGAVATKISQEPWKVHAAFVEALVVVQPDGVEMATEGEAS